MLEATALVVGLSSQCLFSMRMISQWFVSERAGRITVTASFWYVSIVSSLLMMLYGVLRKDPTIVLGQLIIYFIYIRNLQLMGHWRHQPFALRHILILLPALGAMVCAQFSQGGLSYFTQLVLARDRWFALGSFAQLLFILRFLLQWQFSERTKNSNLPMSFWIASFLGATSFVIYAIERRDLVLFLGHASGLFIYSRSILLCFKNREWERCIGA